MRRRLPSGAVALRAVPEQIIARRLAACSAESWENAIARALLKPRSRSSVPKKARTVSATAGSRSATLASEMSTDGGAAAASEASGPARGCVLCQEGSQAMSNSILVLASGRECHSGVEDSRQTLHLL